MLPHPTFLLLLTPCILFFRFQGAKNYWISGAKVGWEKASNACRKDNGTLASIHSRWEQSFIQTILNTIVPGHGVKEKDFWIGLWRANSNQGFSWSDGSPFDFKFWYKTEPESSNCASIWGKNPHFEWGSDGCQDQQKYICTFSGMQFFIGFK